MSHLFRVYCPLFVLLLTLVLTTIVYWSGLSGNFRFDDIINITQNPDIHINTFNWSDLKQAALSTVGGFRPLSMLSFSVNHALTGLDPFYFKLTNLFIHLLCGIGIFWLTYLLLNAYRLRYHPKLTDTEIGWLSVTVSAAWLLHPFNLTSVLYIVQRMASLAALFMVFGLALYTWGRLRQLRGRPGATLIVASFISCGLLAVLSKENGILLSLLILITEWFFFGFQALKSGTRRFVIGFNIVIGIIPGLLILSFLILRFDWVLAGYDTRDFTLNERLLTQARVLWFYIQMILLPNPTQMGMYHDDIALSKNLFEPFTTLPAVLGIIALLISATLLRRFAPLLSFGVLFFFAGHALESTIISLEIAHEHRNYLPGYGLILIAIYYMGHRSLRERMSIHIQTVFFFALIMALAATTANRASYWANEVDLALMEVRYHPNSTRSNMQAGYVFFYLAGSGIEPEINSQRARHYFETAWRLDDYNLSGRFGLLLLDDLERRATNTSLINDLVNKLAYGPLAASSTNTVMRIGRCQNEGGCRIPPEDFKKIFHAILHNPALHGKPRAKILTEFAQFMISQNDLDLTLSLTQQALVANPNDPQIYLNKAHVLIHLGELEAARQAIDHARALDRHAFLANRIREQERLLERALAAQPTNSHAPVGPVGVQSADEPH